MSNNGTTQIGIDKVPIPSRVREQAVTTWWPLRLTDIAYSDHETLVEVDVIARDGGAPPIVEIGDELVGPADAPWIVRRLGRIGPYGITVSAARNGD